MHYIGEVKIFYPVSGINFERYEVVPDGEGGEKITRKAMRAIAADKDKKAYQVIPITSLVFGQFKNRPKEFGKFIRDMVSTILGGKPIDLRFDSYESTPFNVLEQEYNLLMAN